MRPVQHNYRKLVLVCANVKDNGKECCGAKGGANLHVKLKEAMAAADPLVRVSKTGCLGPCAQGANVVIMPDGLWLGGCTEADIPEIVRLAVAGKTDLPDEDGDFLET